MNYNFGKLSFDDSYLFYNQAIQRRIETDGFQQYTFNIETIRLAKSLLFTWEFKEVYYGGMASNSFSNKEELISFVEKHIPLEGNIKDKLETALEHYRAALFYIRSLLKTENYKITPATQYTSEVGGMVFLSKAEENKIKFFKEIDPNNTDQEKYPSFNKKHYKFRELSISKKEMELFKYLMMDYTDTIYEDNKGKVLDFSIAGGLCSNLKRPLGSSDILEDISETMGKTTGKRTRYLYKMRKILAIVLDRSHLGTTDGTYRLEKGHWVKV